MLGISTECRLHVDIGPVNSCAHSKFVTGFAAVGRYEGDAAGVCLAHSIEATMSDIRTVHNLVHQGTRLAVIVMSLSHLC